MAVKKGPMTLLWRFVRPFGGGVKVLVKSSTVGAAMVYEEIKLLRKSIMCQKWFS